ncbi:LuxR C-terminal-related transcriptional regulator [Algibacter sp. 2305UL17-15]|uniref:LuxR C-terminal-related transcriptional regulator n=1 Tax=Algibacter sp. 2305UL17-15 TaxID=3231268 RepID=UPI0034591F7C
MRNKNALKVTQVWETENKILLPSNKKVFIDVIEQVASLFSIGSFYYYIIDFNELKMDYVFEGVTDILGIPPETLTVNKLLDIMHPDDLASMPEKETFATSFLFGDITKDQLPDYKVVYLMRLKHINGSYKTILHQAQCLIPSKDGKVEKVLGVHTDVTYLNAPFDNRISFISHKHPSFHYRATKTGYKLIEKESHKFSKRELEIIDLLAKGKQAKEISKILYISILTVNTHKRNIFKKVHCKNTSELMAICLREGVI